jgi:putative ABC transport system permease protein
MITKLTIRNLRANTGRFAMTTFGVVLAVSFVVSAFVLGDGLRRTFADLSTEIVAGTDFEVRPIEQFGSIDFLTDADVATVLAVDGVADAVGLVEAPENSVRPITPAGEEIPTAGPPQLAFSWSDSQGFSPFTLVQGASPERGEFLLDLDSADRHGFEVGETYTVVTATGRHELTLSGLTRFGTDNQTLGATLMSMNAGETDELFGTTGYDAIAVALTQPARADAASVQEALAAVMPDLDIVDQVMLTDEASAEFNSEIGMIQNVLLGFAGVSLLVSVFIIANTFAIVLQQRTREMGLLRLVGADASQLRRSAMGEAGFIGVLASAIGIPGGIGVAAGLTALFSAIGLDLPAYDMIVAPRTIVVSLVVGIGVTLVAAWWPTRSATRLTPMAALAGGIADGHDTGRGRLITGAVLALVGGTAVALGLLGSASTAAIVTLLVIGAVALFGAVTAVSPRLVAPVAAAFGVLFERFGMPGRLAVRNARRQAGRTATTAAALMIGLAVVSMALVVGDSIKTELSSTLDSTVRADYLLTDQASEAGFPTQVVDALAAEPAFGAVTGFRTAEMEVADEIVEVTAARFDDLPELFDLGITAGGFGDPTISVLVSDELVESDGVAIGDTVDVLLDTGSSANLAVTGVFTDDAIVAQDWLVDIAVFDAGGVTAGEQWVAFNAASDASITSVTTAVERIETLFPQGELETAAEFVERMEGLIDQILSVLNVLVALAVVIALIGIANTLALSVSERTREIGLVRAVGMSRRGVRRMIRYESAVIATFGAVLGVVMGLGLGWMMVEALPASFTDTLSVPVGQIVTLLCVATAAGLVAAVLPARRAGRMNVLAAIAG